MKLKYSLFFWIILILASSCVRKIFTKKTIVEGTVTVKQTGEPLAGITVSVRKVLSPRYSQKIAEFTTDENGHYYYEFYAERDTDYIVFGESDSCYYFLQGFTSTDLLLENGKKNVHDFVCKAQTRLIFHIINTTPYDENDKFELFDCFSCDGYPLITKTGTNIDEFYYYKWEVLSYKYFYFAYMVTKNNLTTTYKDSVYINSVCSIDTITINY